MDSQIKIIQMQAKSIVNQTKRTPAEEQSIYENFTTRFQKFRPLNFEKKIKGFLLFGNSRVGKSTIYTSMIGDQQCNFQIQYDDNAGKALLLPMRAEHSFLVGCTNTSHTETPNYKLRGAKYNQYLVVDLPGFADSDPVRELINFHYIKSIVEKLDELALGMVVTIAPKGGKKFQLEKHTLKMMEAFMDMFPNRQNRLTLIVNIVDSTYSDADIKASIKEQIANIKFPNFLEFYGKLQSNSILIINKPKYIGDNTKRQKSWRIPQNIQTLYSKVLYSAVLPGEFKSLSILSRLDQNQLENLEFNLKVYVKEAARHLKISFDDVLRNLENFVTKFQTGKHKDFQLKFSQQFKDKIDAPREQQANQLKFSYIQNYFAKIYEGWSKMEEFDNGSSLSEKMKILQNDLSDIFSNAKNIMAFTFKSDAKKFNSMNRQLANIKDIIVSKLKELNFIFSTIPINSKMSFHFESSNQEQRKTFQEQFGTQMEKVFLFRQNTEQFNIINPLINIFKTFYKQDEEKLLNNAKNLQDIISIYTILIQSNDLVSPENDKKDIKVRKINTRCYELLRTDTQIKSLQNCKNNSKAIIDLWKQLEKDKCVTLIAKRKELAHRLATNAEYLKEYELAIEFFQALRMTASVKRNLDSYEQSENENQKNLSIDFLEKRADFFRKEGHLQRSIEIWGKIIELHQFNLDKVLKVKQKMIQAMKNQNKMLQNMTVEQNCTPEVYWNDEALLKAFKFAQDIKNCFSQSQRSPHQKNRYQSSIFIGNPELEHNRSTKAFSVYQPLKNTMKQMKPLQNPYQ